MTFFWDKSKIVLQLYYGKVFRHISQVFEVHIMTKIYSIYKKICFQRSGYKKNII